MIFICHSSSDQRVTAAICNSLERDGFVCWISSRDIGPGENFQEAIFNAIQAATTMILVVTSNANISDEIKKELALASRRKLVVIPLRVENVTPSAELAYELMTRQWIDWFEDQDRAIIRLKAQLNKVGEANYASAADSKAEEKPNTVPKSASVDRRDSGSKPLRLSLASKPRLPRGVRLTYNEPQGGWVLLAPERIFRADAIAAEIIKRCDGRATVAEIVDDLAKTFNAPRERIETDVTAMLTGLVEKRLMEIA